MVFNRLLSGWIFSKEEDPARFFRDVKAVSNGDRYSYRFTSTRRKPTTRQSLSQPYIAALNCVPAWLAAASVHSL
jgi:hypothetical protein